jgi:hypothetical protein
MLQKNSLASEKHYACDFCGKAIISPICQWCLAQEVQAWMTLYPDLDEKLMPGIDDYLSGSDNPAFESTICIKCGCNSASICPSCFVDFVLLELENIEANNIVVEEFLEFFSFDKVVPNPHAEKWGYGELE